MPDERTSTRTTQQVDAEEYAAGAPSLRCDTNGSKRPCYHLVVSGNTLTGIAATYKVKYPDDIKRWNPQFFPPQGNPNVIKPGQRVTIKKAGAP